LAAKKIVRIDAVAGDVHDAHGSLVMMQRHEARYLWRVSRCEGRDERKKVFTFADVEDDARTFRGKIEHGTKVSEL
jgi:hypothetical protein